MNEGRSTGLLLGLWRLALLVLVLSRALTIEPEEFKHLGTPTIHMDPSTVGILAAGYLLVTAGLSAAVQASWRYLALLVLDLLMASFVFMAFPNPTWALLFGLPVLEAFHVSSHMGALAAIGGVILFAGEAHAVAPDRLMSNHIPFALSAMGISSILGMAIQAQQRSAHQKQALIRIIEASQELGATATIEKVMQVVCEMVTALFRANHVAVYLLDEENPDQPLMKAKGVESASPEAFPDFNPEVTPSLLHSVLKERQGHFFTDFNNQDTGNERILAKDKDFRSVMLAPLMFEGKALGSMFCSFSQPNRYRSETFHLYSLLSSQVALAVRNVQLHQGMAALAITDSLSGLFTHGYFQDHLGKEVTKCKYANQSLALMILDMDFFKKVNDNYGHPQGDALLRQLGGVIKSVVRPNDTVCRYGGDEFTITMPETNRIQAVVVAERIRQAVEEYEFVLGSHIVHITVSGGVAAFPEEATTKKELVDKADQAMYEAKHKGRNKVCFAA